MFKYLEKNEIPNQKSNKSLTAGYARDCHSFHGDSSDLKGIMLSRAHVLGSVLWRNRMSGVRYKFQSLLAYYPCDLTSSRLSFSICKWGQLSLPHKAVGRSPRGVYTKRLAQAWPMEILSTVMHCLFFAIFYSGNYTQ